MLTSDSISTCPGTRLSSRRITSPSASKTERGKNSQQRTESSNSICSRADSRITNATEGIIIDHLIWSLFLVPSSPVQARRRTDLMNWKHTLPADLDFRCRIAAPMALTYFRAGRWPTELGLLCLLLGLLSGSLTFTSLKTPNLVRFLGQIELTNVLLSL